MKIGDVVRSLRKARGWNQTALAERAWPLLDDKSTGQSKLSRSAASQEPREPHTYYRN